MKASLLHVSSVKISSAGVLDTDKVMEFIGRELIARCGGCQGGNTTHITHQCLPEVSLNFGEKDDSESVVMSTDLLDPTETSSSTSLLPRG